MLGATLKVLIHPGFHKTGTTTLQRTLFVNRHALADTITFLTPDHTRDLSMLARRISIVPGRGKFAKLARAYVALLDSRQDIRSRPLLLSNEHLCGHIPGRNGVRSYHQAPHMLRALVQASMDYFGPDTEHYVYFTTRDAKAWCKSTFWQNIRYNRITTSLEDYEARELRDCDLGETVRQVREALPPEVQVISADVGEAAHPLGALEHMLRLLDVNTDGLKAVRAQNTQPPGGIEEILRLNRSDLTDEALAVEKGIYLESLKDRRPSRRRAVSSS